MSETQTNAVANNNPQPAAAPAFTTDSIERAYFGPDALGDAATLREKILTVLPESKLHYNFDLAAENAIPAGYGLYIVPVRQRNEIKKENELIGVAFYTAPSFETVMADPSGSEYVREALFGAMSAKMANSIRPTRDGTLAKAPFSLADFIERKVRGDSFKTWNDLKKSLVAALREIGLKTINAQVLRQCFSNAAVAESQYPKVSQEQWGKLLDFATHQAKKKNLDPAVFEGWKATREDATLADDVLNFDALQALDAD